MLRGRIWLGHDTVEVVEVVTHDEIIDASARIRSALFRLLAAQRGGSDACADEIMRVAPELAGLPLELVLVEAVTLVEAALFIDESPFCSGSTPSPKRFVGSGSGRGKCEGELVFDPCDLVARERSFGSDQLAQRARPEHVHALDLDRPHKQ